MSYLFARASRESSRSPSDTAWISTRYSPTEASSKGSTSKVRASESPASKKRLSISMPLLVMKLTVRLSGTNAYKSNVPSPSLSFNMVRGKLIVRPSSSDTEG